MLQVQIGNQSFLVSGLLTISAVPPAPAAPSNLNILDSSTDTAADISWDNNAVNATNNEIWRSDSGGAFFLLATVAPDSITYTDGTLPGGSGEYAEYKVRATNAGGSSAFTEARGLASGLGILGLVVYDYPRLVLHVNDFVLTNNTTTVISFPLLRRISLGGALSISAPLTTFSVPSLTLIDGACSVISTHLTTISFPALTNVGSAAVFNSNTFLTSLSIPLVSAFPSDLFGFSCPALSTLALSALQTVGGGFAFPATSVTSLHFPNLVSVGDVFDFSSNVNLTSIDIGSLQTTGSDFSLSGCSALPSLAANALNAVNGSSFSVMNCSLLTSISLTALNALGGDFVFSNCPVLVTLNIPQAVFMAGAAIDGSGDALNAGSVNQVLSRGVAGGTTFADFELAGGTNAAPTGQGLADKATLIAAGNTVNTN